MALVPISAVDAVAPAFDRMGQLLFRPFRGGMWLRLFVVGLFTGELSSGAGFSFNLPVNLFSKAFGQHRHFAPVVWSALPKYLPLIAALILIGVVVMLIFMYLGAVLRFVLLEAVVRGQFRLRASFRRWRSVAGSLFVLQLWMTLVLWGVLLLLVAGPLLKLWRAGFDLAVLRTMLVQLVLTALLVFLISLAFALIWLFIKDFAVPMMALEELSATRACARLWQMMRAAPGAFAGYLGMKIVLTMAAGIAASVLFLIAALFLLLPAILLIVFGAVGRSSAAPALAMALGIALVVVFILVAVVLAFMIGVVAMVFFQAYVVRYLAGRYEPLAIILFPQLEFPAEPALET